MSIRRRNLYYAAICPYCKWKILGNAKEAQTGQMWQHIIDKHVTGPIVLRTDGKGNELIKK